MKRLLQPNLIRFCLGFFYYSTFDILHIFIHPFIWHEAPGNMRLIHTWKVRPRTITQHPRRVQSFTVQPITAAPVLPAVYAGLESPSQKVSAYDGSCTQRRVHRPLSSRAGCGWAATTRLRFVPGSKFDQPLRTRAQSVCVAAEHCVRVCACCCVCMFLLGQQLAKRAVTYPPRLWRHPAPNHPGCHCVSWGTSQGPSPAPRPCSQTTNLWKEKHHDLMTTIRIRTRQDGQKTKYIWWARN